MAASCSETTVMQLVQEATIQAQVRQLQQRSPAACSPAGDQQQQQPQSANAAPPPPQALAATGAHPGSAQGLASAPGAPIPGAQALDRTGLLASSLAHLCMVIDALNAQDHGLSIALFAGLCCRGLFCLPRPPG